LYCGHSAHSFELQFNLVWPCAFSHKQRVYKKMLLRLSLVCVIYVKYTTIWTSAITLTRAHCVRRAARSAGRLGNIILHGLIAFHALFFFCFHFTPRGDWSRHLVRYKPPLWPTPSLNDSFAVHRTFDVTRDDLRGPLPNSRITWMSFEQIVVLMRREKMSAPRLRVVFFISFGCRLKEVANVRIAYRPAPSNNVCDDPLNYIFDLARGTNRFCFAVRFGETFWFSTMIFTPANSHRSVFFRSRPISSTQTHDSTIGAQLGGYSRDPPTFFTFLLLFSPLFLYFAK